MRDKTIKTLYGLRKSYEEKQRIGLEIEMEGEFLGLGDIGTYWNISGDGSLRGEGVEYKLRKPMSLQGVQQALDLLWDQARRQKATFHPSRRCAVHIHINCLNKTEQETFNFICLYLILEDLLTHWCGEDREGNLFCLRSSDAEDLLFALRKAKQQGCLSYAIDGDYKYSAICIPALRKFGSLEFRSMKTPKDRKEIITWIKLLLRVEKSSKMFKDPKEMVEQLSHLGEKPFLRKVMTTLAHRLMFKNVEEMMIRGARNVQEIAYTETKKVKRISNKKLADDIWRIVPAPRGVERGDVVRFGDREFVAEVDAAGGGPRLRIIDDIHERPVEPPEPNPPEDEGAQPMARMRGIEEIFQDFEEQE